MRTACRVGWIGRLPRGGVTKADWLGVMAEFERQLNHGEHAGQYEVKVAPSRVGGFELVRYPARNWADPECRDIMFYKAFAFHSPSAWLTLCEHELWRVDAEDAVMKFARGRSQPFGDDRIAIDAVRYPRAGGFSAHEYAALYVALLGAGIRTTCLRYAARHS